MKMKDSLRFLIPMISGLLAVSTLVRASNPFGFSNDELSKIAKLEVSDRTPILKSLVYKATDRNWCCENGLNSCQNQICCPGFLQVANECIYIEDLIPVFLQILKELLDIGVIEICGGTGTFPTKSPTTTTESEPITSQRFTRPSSTASTTTVASTTTTSRFTYPTTTTKTTTLPTTTTKRPSAAVYVCNFDKDNCGAQVNAEDNLDFTSLLRFENKTITDVTSITKQTGTKPAGPYNGPVCNIPWQQPNQLNYFCSVNHECLAGEPGNQGLYYCQNGKFAWANAHQKHTSFKKTFKLNSISLSEAGIYRIVFWALLKCQTENCGRQELDDSITVTVDDKLVKVSQEVNYFKAGDREGWQMYDLNYFTESTSIDITVDFERRIWSQIDALFAIDEISIIRI